MMPRVLDTALFQQYHQFQGEWELLWVVFIKTVYAEQMNRDVQCSVYNNRTQTVNGTVTTVKEATMPSSIRI
jgi:hypothetical protein